MLPTDDEAADGLTALLQRHRPLVVRRWPERCRPPPAVGGPDVDRHRVEAELALQAGDQCREEFVPGVWADVIDDAADHLQRVVANAPHEPVDGVADPTPDRFDAHRIAPVAATSSQVGPLPPTSRPSPATSPCRRRRWALHRASQAIAPWAMPWKRPGPRAGTVDDDADEGGGGTVASSSSDPVISSPGSPTLTGSSRSEERADRGATAPAANQPARGRRTATAWTPPRRHQQSPFPAAADVATTAQVVASTTSNPRRRSPGGSGRRRRRRRHAPWPTGVCSGAPAASGRQERPRHEPRRPARHGMRPFLGPAVTSAHAVPVGRLRRRSPLPAWSRRPAVARRGPGRARHPGESA